MQNKLVDAEAMLLRALAGREKVLGPGDVKTLNTVHGLGTIYQRQNKMIEAAAFFQRALDGYGKILGLEHKITLDTIHDLGEVYAEIAFMPD
jgi:hypothetical protein